ncbi:tetratricopeptide repeat protein [Massilia sp. H6]|uniref:tetratricopeptide repeat protein n=1 Tax=Massilia sp. H6 TaxID=2970464 RepID=UPI00216722C2|nr:tetratricopeptide repeat protein [Massilia sp. H6]UVW27654.1 tetratricopeptide repeat protein [Massilia sp. H6]
MDKNGLTTLLPPLDNPGAITTLYSYEGGPARNGLLAAMALQLAGEPMAGPVLMIDWDLDAPSLHAYAGQDAAPAHDEGAAQDHPEHPEHPPGLAEYVAALRERLQVQREFQRGAHGDCGEALADAVLDSVDWRRYIERADGRHRLYLMRAGRFDDTYPDRAERLDWDALFDACPALLRRFAARMRRHFSHVLIASRGGRSASVSVCTTLLPDRIVGLFTPAPGSLDGLEGVVRRAIDYRCTHEDEQRPLLVYPMACSAEGARSDPGQRWRRGDSSQGLAGYQPRLEALLRAAYGMTRLRLDSWFDELQLPLADALAIAGPGADWRALARPAACLLSWFRQGDFPWHSLAEVRLRREIERARVPDAALASSVALAASLARLGVLCRDEGRTSEAADYLAESLALRRAALGQDHAQSRAGLRLLAALQHGAGRLHEARRDYELLAQGCARSVGAEHPDTLAARSRLARVLGQLGEGERALALHEQVVAICERLWGDTHVATLDSLEDLAVTLAGQHEFDRARVLCERVLDGRRCLQGGEHDDTLRCSQRLAQLLGEMGDLGNARRLLESVLRARERHDGADAAPTLQAREALADILAAQGDLAAVRRIQESLAWTRERHLGASHPDTLSIQLRLASTLGQQGEEEAARRLRGRVADLRQRLEEAGGSSGGGTAAGDSAARTGPVLQERYCASTPRGRYAGAGQPASDDLQGMLAQLHDLLERHSRREARALADRLRQLVLRASVAHPLRRRGAALIKQVYRQDGDKDALLAFTQDELASLEGALFGSDRDNPAALH